MAAILVLGVGLVAIPAGRRPFWSQDEARFAVLARDMVEHGRWLVPEVRERPYLNKPQLYIWSIAAVSLARGGITERTAAVPSVLSAIAIVGAVVAIGRRLWGWPTGLIAGLLLVATPVHFLFGHSVLPDPMLVAWLTWALWAYLAAAERAWSPALMTGFYGCIAGALLTKGPVALVAIPVAALATALTDGARALPRMQPLRGAAVVAVSALPWIIPYYLRGGEAFAHGTVQAEYVRWVIDNPAAAGVADIAVRLRHVLLALAGFLPWTLLLVGAAVWWRRAPDGGRRRVLVWTISWWLATGLSGNFRTRYLLVVYPAFTLLAAEFAATAAQRHGRRLVALAVAATAVVVALFPVGISMIPGLLAGEDRVFVPDTSWERVTLGGLGIVGAVLALVMARRRTPLAATATLALAVTAVLVVEGLTYPGRYARTYDIRPLAGVIRRATPADGPVIGHPDLRLSYDFYVDRPVIEIPAADALLRRLGDSAAPASLVTSAERWAALASQLGPEWRVAGTTAIAGRTIVVATRTRREAPSSTR